MFKWFRKLFRRREKPQIEIDDEIQETLEELAVAKPSEPSIKLFFLVMLAFVPYLIIGAMYRENPYLRNAVGMLGFIGIIALSLLLSYKESVGKNFMKMRIFRQDVVSELQLEVVKTIELKFEEGFLGKMVRETRQMDKLDLTGKKWFQDAFKNATGKELPPEMLTGEKVGELMKAIERGEITQEELLRRKDEETQANGGKDQVEVLEKPAEKTGETEESSEYKSHEYHEVLKIIEENDMRRLSKKSQREITKKIVELYTPLVESYKPSWYYYLLLAEDGRQFLCITPAPWGECFTFQKEEIDIGILWAPGQITKASSLLLGFCRYLWYGHKGFLQRVMPVLLVTDCSYYHRKFLQEMGMLDLSTSKKERYKIVDQYDGFCSMYMSFLFQFLTQEVEDAHKAMDKMNVGSWEKTKKMMEELAKREKIGMKSTEGGLVQTLSEHKLLAFGLFVGLILGVVYGLIAGGYMK